MHTRLTYIAVYLPNRHMHMHIVPSCKCYAHPMCSERASMHLLDGFVQRQKLVPLVCLRHFLHAFACLCTRSSWTLNEAPGGQICKCTLGAVPRVTAIENASGSGLGVSICGLSRLPAASYPSRSQAGSPAGPFLQVRALAPHIPCCLRVCGAVCLHVVEWLP
jgi:hypothetical protein